MKRKVCIATICLLMLGFSSVAQVRKKLTEAEATRRFEEFVIENGYTDLPFTKDKSKRFSEPVWGGADDETMKLRHDSLERKPVYVRRGNRFYRNGWLAFFLFKKSSRPNIGRLIYMDAYGKRMYVEHQDISLEEIQPKKPH